MRNEVGTDGHQWDCTGDFDDRLNLSSCLACSQVGRMILL